MDAAKLDNSKLIVNYLPPSLTDEGLRSLFETVGVVNSVKLMRNKAGESLAYGFVNFESSDDGLHAISTLNGIEREGKTMKVSVATPRFIRETTNLYVADLPEMATETGIRELFEQYGEVNNCKLVVNQETGLSRGVAFVLFHHAHEAESAIQGLNGTYYPGITSDKTITVKIKVEPKSQNPDLYVANIPKAMDDETLKTYFSAYGEVRTCKIVRDANTGASKGVAFVGFSHRKESVDAIAGLHDTRLPGSTQNLVVKVKEQKEDKNASTERENGGGPMRRGTYGNNRYNPTSALPPPPPPPHGFAPPPYGYHPPSGAYPPSGGYPPPGRFSLEDAKAQPAHQLFIHNLGSDADEAELYELFAPFGAVTKVFPMRDPESRKCKGFGFVEMPDYDAAVLAIAALNGMPYKLNNMKPLKVDFKTQKNKQ